jgi:nucleotide-binding universal stress UspA family protein
MTQTSRHVILVALFSLALSPAAFADRAADVKSEAASVAAVEGASITILSPTDGSHLTAGEEYPLQYEVKPGKGGDHFHVWVDDKRGPGIHDYKGTYTLPKLTPGEHVIYIGVVDKGHVSTGPKKSIVVVAGADADKKK